MNKSKHANELQCLFIRPPRAGLCRIALELPSFSSLFRILVLDKGFVVEFDTPASLLEQKGIFYGMARDAGLVRGDEGPAIQVSQDE